MTDSIQQISILASFRDGELEAVVYKNGGDPILYKVEKMNIDDIKGYLETVNLPTQKI